MMMISMMIDDWWLMIDDDDNDNYDDDDDACHNNDHDDDDNVLSKTKDHKLSLYHENAALSKYDEGKEDPLKNLSKNSKNLSFPSNASIRK